jgi:hypothetical protein
MDTNHQKKKKAPTHTKTFENRRLTWPHAKRVWKQTTTEKPGRVGKVAAAAASLCMAQHVLHGPGHEIIRAQIARGSQEEIACAPLRDQGRVTRRIQGLNQHAQRLAAETQGYSRHHQWLQRTVEQGHSGCGAKRRHGISLQTMPRVQHLKKGRSPFTVIITTTTKRIVFKSHARKTNTPQM